MPTRSHHPGADASILERPPRGASSLRRTFMRSASAAALLSACRPAQPSIPSPIVRERDLGQLGPIHGHVGSYVSHAWSLATLSYWIEGPLGLLLVDTQLLTTSAEQFVDLAEATTGKRTELAVVLHAHPDKFNGTRTLQDRGVRVVTSEQVASLIPIAHDRHLRQVDHRDLPACPKERPRPEVFGNTTSVLSVAGLQVRAHVLGPGCSEAHVVLQWSDHVFVGDLVAKDCHGRLENGQPQAWLTRLTEIEQMKPRHVHPGRGGSGGPELLTAQRNYLEFVLARVTQERPSGPPDPRALARIRADIHARYPDHRFPALLDTSLPAVWTTVANGR